MNFLAHAYLSFRHPDILIGNMISDFVKGKNRFNYSKEIQDGILLHRQIDAFTDLHPATKEAKIFLKPAVGLYAGAFVDVIYDHFLANDPDQFSDTSLKQLAADTYQTLRLNNHTLPPVFQQMLPSMQLHNWLYNYRYLQGIEKSFGGVVRRAAYLSSSEAAFDLFQIHYTELQICYKNFFPFVKAFSLAQIAQLTK